MDDSFSVESLIKNAAELLEQEHYRAAVMEAMTALEERANEVVFQSLETRKALPPDLVKWIKDKTKYSFDEKLHPIGEYALGKQISKGEALWASYKTARDLRNKVSHTAQKIKGTEARFVIQTVKEWLYFLEGAQDVHASDEMSDLTMEFLSLYAFLASRFRYPKSDKPVSMTLAAINAAKRGQLSAEAVQLILETIAHRNKVAHGQLVQTDQLSELVRKLKILIRDMKGTELDATPMEGHH